MIKLPPLARSIADFIGYGTICRYDQTDMVESNVQQVLCTEAARRCLKHFGKQISDFVVVCSLSRGWKIGEQLNGNPTQTHGIGQQLLCVTLHAFVPCL